MEWARWTLLMLLLFRSVCSTARYQRRRSLMMCHMYCQTGYYIEIHPNGSVNGLREDTSPHAMLELLRIAVQTVCIRGVTSGNYLCMSKKGHIYATKDRGVDCVFEEEYLPVDNYYLYSSQKHRHRQKKMYLAVSKSGKPRPGRRRAQKRTLFYVQLAGKLKRWRRG